jgi:hypothetical protein
MQASTAACRTLILGRHSAVKTIVCKVHSKLAGTKNAQMATQLARENSNKLLKSNI